MGFNMLNALYANPPAPLLAGNLLSSHFPVCRGSHQGCPLSALLFALSQSQNATPVTGGNTDHFISLYADDILFYLGCGMHDLPHILSVLASFNTFSGCKKILEKKGHFYHDVIYQTTQSPHLNTSVYISFL